MCCTFFAQQEGFLWWPENYLEAEFVSNTFSSTSGLFHLGVLSARKNEGLIFSDNSFGTGIFGFSNDKINGEEFIFGDFDLLSDSECLIWNKVSKEVEMRSPCPKAKGICKRKLCKSTSKIECTLFHVI